MNGMTHEQYVAKCRLRASALATQILEGTVDVLEASSEMARLRWEVEVAEDDLDFDVFSVVASETDALPIGSQRQFWAEDALQLKEPEMRRAREWARQTVAAECANIIRRFGQPAILSESSNA